MIVEYLDGPWEGEKQDYGSHPPPCILVPHSPDLAALDSCSDSRPIKPLRSYYQLQTRNGRPVYVWGGAYE